MPSVSLLFRVSIVGFLVSLLFLVNAEDYAR